MKSGGSGEHLRLLHRLDARNQHISFSRIRRAYAFDRCVSFVLLSGAQLEVGDGFSLSHP
jgi:hypothetical protein